MRDIGPEVLVLTTGHHPADARLARHVDALADHGVPAAVLALEAPTRWRRFAAAPAFTLTHLRRRRPRAVIFPDPELFLLGPLIARALGVRPVIDIHEDYRRVAAARGWIPAPLRPLVRLAAAGTERLGRLSAAAVVVAAPELSRPGDRLVSNLPHPRYFSPRNESDLRLVYVGDVAATRGAAEMVELAAALGDVTLELIGPVSAEAARLLDDVARREGLPSDRLVLAGRLPYEEAWRRAAGALAGLSLLHPTPAYLRAVPSKLWEYMASGIPVIASDLPAQADLVRRAGCGAVVGSVEEAAVVVRRWRDDPEERRRRADAGREFYSKAAAADSSSAELLAAVGGTPTPI